MPESNSVTEEQAFIRAILDQPADTALRLVYADWLEERGDAESMRRAEFLRVECEMDGLPTNHPKRAQRQTRLRELRAKIDDEWWQQLDWAPVDYCVKFEYQCPQRWDSLQPTDDPAVRHCPECRQKVYYCRSAREVERRADSGECVAIDSRHPRLPLGLLRTRVRSGRLLGKVAPSLPKRPPLTERGRKRRPKKRSRHPELE